MEYYIDLYIDLEEIVVYLGDIGYRILVIIKYWKFFYSYFYGSLNWFNRVLLN